MIYKKGKDYQMYREGRIFKLCRVHNMEDYLTAVDNGVNMIGIHAVYSCFEAYKSIEENYSPIERPEIRTHRNLPIADYEVSSIRYMVENMDSKISIALILENELSNEDIAECIRLYNLDGKNPFLQLQFRISYARCIEIKKELNNNLICTVGLNQADFEEYLKFLNRVLDPDKDFILIDFSKHQPDYLTKKVDISCEATMDTLEKKVRSLRNNKIPLLIADDTEVEKMQDYLKFLSVNNIRIAGIDMQNSVEISKKYQSYKLDNINDEQLIQVKIRKSNEKLQQWKLFVSKKLNIY